MKDIHLRGAFYPGNIEALAGSAVGSDSIQEFLAPAVEVLAMALANPVRNLVAFTWSG